MGEVNPLDLVETIREGILVLEPDLTIRFANRSFCHTLAVTPEHTVGRKLFCRRSASLAMITGVGLLLKTIAVRRWH